MISGRDDHGWIHTIGDSSIDWDNIHYMISGSDDHGWIHTIGDSSKLIDISVWESDTCYCGWDPITIS